MSLYILNDNGEPVAENNPLIWARFMDKKKRFCFREEIGESIVSTVFLGMDHNFTGKGPPVLWETMVFEGPFDEYQTRCSGSREQAEAMHNSVIEKVKNQ